MTVKKDERIQFRLSKTLKDRFEICLEHEGLTESDFFLARIQSFCENTERKMLEKQRSSAK